MVAFSMPHGLKGPEATPKKEPDKTDNEDRTKDKEDDGLSGGKDDSSGHNMVGESAAAQSTAWMEVRSPARDSKIGGRATIRIALSVARAVIRMAL